MSLSMSHTAEPRHNIRIASHNGTERAQTRALLRFHNSRRFAPTHTRGEPGSATVAHESCEIVGNASDYQTRT